MLTVSMFFHWTVDKMRSLSVFLYVPKATQALNTDTGHPGGYGEEVQGAGPELSIHRMGRYLSFDLHRPAGDRKRGCPPALV
jgi:hypothetical protein